ncbi:MAG: DUF4062 domain-containing protein [Planctomycetes bacterium]|nr:DUF4062 domain-containing protein [Planctomycetota bacterium]
MNANVRSYRPRVFLSSTYGDLWDYREAAIAQIERSGFDVEAMERWGASDDRPRQLCLDKVARCDVFVLIVAFTRGFVPPGGARSITELEYDCARDHGIPILVFMIDDRATWPAMLDHRATDPRIETWRRRLRAQHKVCLLGKDDHDELRQRLEASLVEERQARPLLLKDYPIAFWRALSCPTRTATRASIRPTHLAGFLLVSALIETVITYPVQRIAPPVMETQAGWIVTLATEAERTAMTDAFGVLSLAEWMRNAAMLAFVAVTFAAAAWLVTRPTPVRVRFLEAISRLTLPFAAASLAGDLLHLLRYLLARHEGVSNWTFMALLGPILYLELYCVMAVPFFAAKAIVRSARRAIGVLVLSVLMPLPLIFVPLESLEQAYLALLRDEVRTPTVDDSLSRAAEAKTIQERIEHLRDAQRRRSHDLSIDLDLV